MPRYTRKRLILAKTEGTYGVDAVPAAATDSLLVSEINSQFEPNNVPRNLIRPYFGASEELVGTRSVVITFNVELAGSGTAGDVPAWGFLLEACAMDGAAESGVRVDYLPITDAVPSVTLYYHRDGVLRKALGCRGSARLKAVAGEMPVLAFTFRGLDGGVTATALPTDADFSAFVTPLIPTDANSDTLVLGATLSSTGAVAFTGGAPIPSLGLEIDIGGATPLVPLIGGESVDFNDRQLMGKVSLDLTASQEVTRQAAVLGATLSSVGFIHGTVPGNRIGLFLPTAQFKNPTERDYQGRALMDYDLTGVPNPAGAGNDEFRLVVF